jgi:hypothetical protein
MDLRKEMDDILIRWGHSILLQRRENEYESDKPEFSNTLEIHTTRHWHGGSAALPMVATEELEGIVHDMPMIYFFRWDANPSRGDRIYENIDLYPNSLSTWLIDQSTPMRYARGRIEFWVCGVSEERPS